MPETDTSRSDRINIDDTVMEIYNLLKLELGREKGTSDLDEAPFNTFKDIFMYAACLGYQNRSRKKLSPGKKTTIRREVFSESDFAILKAIAISDANDVKVLSNIGEIITIAEEYAYAGIFQLKELLIEQNGRPLWNLVSALTIKP